MDENRTVDQTTSDFENRMLDTQDLPHLADVRFEPLPRRFLRFNLLGVGIFALVMSLGWAIPLVVSQFKPPEEMQGVLIFAGVFGMVWVLLVAGMTVAAVRGFAIRGFAVREKDITYRSGWLFRSVTTVPFNRIQHSEISQGPLARAFDLMSLKIYTAGGSSSDLRIPGLEPEKAQRLRDFINGEASEYA